MESVSDTDDDLSFWLNKWQNQGDKESRNALAKTALQAATRMSRRSRVSSPSYDIDDIVLVATEEFLKEAEKGKLNPYQDRLYSVLKTIVDRTAREFSRKEHAQKRHGTISASSLEKDDRDDLFARSIDVRSPRPHDFSCLDEASHSLQCFDESERFYLDRVLERFSSRDADIVRLYYSPTSIDAIAAEFGCSPRTVRRIGERVGSALMELANDYQQEHRDSEVDAVMDLRRKLERVKANKTSQNTAEANMRR